MADTWEATKRVFKKKPESQVVVELKLEHGRAMDRKIDELRKAQRKYETDMGQKEYEMRMRERQLKAEMEQQESDNANNIQNLEARYAYESSKTTEMYEGKMRELESYLSSVTTNAQREKQQAEERVRRINAEHADMVEQLKRTRDVQEDQLIAEHKRRTQVLQEEVAHINAALLSSDNEIYQGAIFTTSGLPRSPDEKVREQFTEIQQIVKNLSRLQWKTDQMFWTDEVLDSLYVQESSGQLGKAILQDMTWCVQSCTQLKVLT